MPEETMSPEFSHYLHNDLNALKGLKGEREDVSTDEKLNVVKEALQNDFERLLDDIIKDVSPTGTPDPTAIMNKALAGLSKVEARRFVLQNLLEAVYPTALGLVPSLQNPLFTGREEILIELLPFGTSPVSSLVAINWLLSQRHCQDMASQTLPEYS